MLPANLINTRFQPGGPVPARLSANRFNGFSSDPDLFDHRGHPFSPVLCRWQRYMDAKSDYSELLRTHR